MPVSASRLENPKLNLILVAGRVTAEDLDGLARAAETSAVTPDRHTLTYLRPDACLEGLPLTALTRLRQAIRGADRLRNALPCRRIALVHAAPADRSLIQLWTAFAAAGDAQSVEIRAFRDPAAAGAWLGLDRATLEDLLQLAL